MAQAEAAKDAKDAKDAEDAKGSKGAAKTRKTAFSPVGVVIAAAVLVGAFFLGAHYFTAKRSTTATVCAASLTSDAITVYRLPSGVLDKFGPKSPSSPVVDIPMADQFTVLDPNKKPVKREAFSIGPKSEKAVAITVNPQGKVCKVEVKGGFFQVEGPVLVKSKREIQLGKESYFVGGTLFLSAGNVTGKSGDDLEGTAETGDVVRVTGCGDQAMVLDVLVKAGTVSVSSNVQGARVFVDGVYRGKTPCTLTATPGAREVSVRADGYLEKKVPVQVESLSKAAVFADLVVETGAVKVSSAPAGAAVSAAGEPKGKTPVTLSLIPGSHELRVELDGYFPKTYRVTVTAGREETVSATLVKKPSDGSEASPDAGKGADAGSQHKFTLKGMLLARNGDVLYIGDRWTECVMAADAVIRDSSGDIPVWRMKPGDTISVSGNSASDLRLVKVEVSAANGEAVHGNLVRTGTGYKVFGEDSIIRVDVPGGLEVIDEAKRSKDPLANVPSGSRVKFRVDPSGKATWAEYVWRAGVSPEGVLGSIRGTIITVIPSWEDLHVSMNTAVFRDDRRTPFFDIRTGDSVLAAGPHANDIRFIWVRERSQATQEALAVTVSRAAKEGKVLQEYGGYVLKGHPIYAGSSLILSDPRNKKTIAASELQYGDRVRLWVDDNRRIVFGEVIQRNDARLSGVFLGRREGSYYFSNFERYLPSEDLIAIGLSPGESIDPGSRVLAAGTAGTVNYIEIQADVKTRTTVCGTVLSSKGSLFVRGDLVTDRYQYAKDAWFVDWDLRQDGPISNLYPGDKVIVSVGLDGKALFAERTYTAPFKLEGTIEAISDRTVVISDKTSRKTVTFLNYLSVVKGDRQGGYWDLAVGDKVKVSGRDKSSIDLIVIE